MVCASLRPCIHHAVGQAREGGGRCYPESPEGSEVRDIVRACRRPCRRPEGNKSIMLLANAAGEQSQPFAGTLPLISLQTRLVGVHGGKQNFPAQGTERKMATPRCVRPLFAHPRESVRGDWGKCSVADLSEMGALSHLHGTRGTDLREKGPHTPPHQHQHKGRDH